MWRNYLTVGIRALAKNRTYAFINIFGLALGIAACLLILLFVRYEFSYDGWLPDADSAFQLQNYYHPTEAGGEELKLQMTSFISGVALQEGFPAGRAARSMSRQPQPVVIKDGAADAVDRGAARRRAIVRRAALAVRPGDPAHALDDPHSLALSETRGEAAVRRPATRSARR